VGQQHENILGDLHVYTMNKSL